MGPWVDNQTKKGWLTSIFELGAWVGCLYSGFIAETLSRKYAIILNVGIFIIGVIVQCMGIISGHSAMLGGRFVVGLAIGAMSVNVPNYNAEVAPPEVRGSLVALQQLAITGGIMVSFWIDSSRWTLLAAASPMLSCRAARALSSAYCSRNGCVRQGMASLPMQMAGQKWMFHQSWPGRVLKPNAIEGGSTVKFRDRDMKIIETV
jgi:MFS family permease